MNNTTSPETQEKLAAQADQARAHGEFNVALVWINKADLLDAAASKRDIKAPVNSSLLGIIFDAATMSEDHALRCGNFTNTHERWVSAMREATALLFKRVSSGANDGMSTDAMSTVALISGHIDLLNQRFVINGYDKVNLPTPVREIQFFVETLVTVRSLVAELADEKTCVDRAPLPRLRVLQSAISQADSHIIARRLMRFLTEWDSAKFYVDAALRHAEQLNATTDGAFGSADEVAQLRMQLKTAQSAIADKDHNSSKSAIASAATLVKSMGGFTSSF